MIRDESIESYLGRLASGEPTPGGGATGGIVDAAARALDLAERVLDAANPNVLSDVGAALGCIRGGLTAAAVTLETNLGPLRDEGLEGIVRTDVDRADRLVARADALLGRVRAAVTG